MLSDTTITVNHQKVSLPTFLAVRTLKSKSEFSQKNIFKYIMKNMKVGDSSQKIQVYLRMALKKKDNSGILKTNNKRGSIIKKKVRFCVPEKMSRKK